MKTKSISSLIRLNNNLGVHTFTCTECDIFYSLNVYLVNAREKTFLFYNRRISVILNISSKNSEYCGKSLFSNKHLTSVITYYTR